MSVMELGHLLTRSGLTYLEVSSEVCHDSFCQLGNSVSLSWVVCHEAFCLNVVSSSSCIPVVCLEPVLFLIPLKCVNLFCNLSKCILLFFSYISSLLLLFSIIVLYILIFKFLDSKMEDKESLHVRELKMNFSALGIVLQIVNSQHVCCWIATRNCGNRKNDRVE